MSDFDFAGWLHWLMHVLSATAIVGAVIGVFTPLAALVAIIWYSLQIYKDSTVQTWLANRRARKIAILRNEIRRLEALGKKDGTP